MYQFKAMTRYDGMTNFDYYDGHVRIGYCENRKQDFLSLDLLCLSPGPTSDSLQAAENFGSDEDVEQVSTFLGIILFLSLLAFSLNSRITGKGSDSHGVTTRDSRTSTNCEFSISRKGPEEKWERKKAKKSKQINWFTCQEFNLFYAYWLVCK